MPVFRIGVQHVGIKQSPGSDPRHRHSQFNRPYRSGIGKYLLAWQPERVQESIISELQWERATPGTITSAQQLRDELGRTRARGWNFDNGEGYPDGRHGYQAGSQPGQFPF
ncbi:TPA: hypothetical protein I8Y09_004556 [Raoultella ornithinolytica]|nr:hypothetical protein [Raoultella ornithinolytica]